MLKISDAVETLLYENEEALYAMGNGFLNLSGFAKTIRRQVEQRTKKELKVPTIVVALSRLQKKVKKTKPMAVDVTINSINTKSPVTELVFDKSEELVKKVGTLRQSVEPAGDDFLSITISTNEIGITCSDRILDGVRTHFKSAPRALEPGLAIISISIDPAQYAMPNITYSLIRRIARKRIVLAETISNYGEIIFTFRQKDLAEMLKLFSK